MFKYLLTRSGQKGVAAILSLLGVSVITLSIISSLAVVTIGELKMSRNGGALEQTFYAAESGLNEALYRLITNPVPGNYSFNFENNTVTITVSVNPDDPFQRILRSQAIDSITGKTKTVQIVANTDSYAAGFDYAVQGGTGGVYLDNNSTVIGDIYSNGDILPASGGATGNVTGSAWVANANMIDKVNVSGNVYAHTISRSDIGGQAFYDTIDNHTDVNGDRCSPGPNPNCHPGSADQDPKDFPIDTTIIQTWKDEIDDIGNPVIYDNPADCPASKSSGFYCITTNNTLGAEKIEADLYVGNGATLILDGNLWVTGNVIMDNNGTIEIDSSLGGGSVVMIADGSVEVNNNYTINGSGDPNSFILVISMDSSIDPGSPAIYAANNSTSIVFLAMNGMLKVKNNGSLNAAVAKVLYLEPNSSVTYNPLLSIFTIPAGGGEDIGTALGTWEEL